jgi:hypothetical protein
VVFRHACQLGFEGIVSKRLGSPYVSGRSWQHIAGVEDYQIALATFRAASERWPSIPITLRQGSRVIEDSRCLRLAWSDRRPPDQARTCAAGFQWRLGGEITSLLPSTSKTNPACALAISGTSLHEGLPL